MPYNGYSCRSKYKFEDVGILWEGIVNLIKKIRGNGDEND